MGREWLYWVGGKGGGGMDRSSARRGGKMGGEDTAAGCMCAVFQLFDLHHFQVPLNHSDTAAHFLQQPETITSSSKGIEAPRNSLEAPGGNIGGAPTSSLPTTLNQNSNFPGGLQIKTRVAPTKSRTEELLSSECSSSNSPGGAKTPNLVARLMGLDILPQCTSPASISRSQTRSHFKDSRTLKRRSTGSFSDDDIGVGVRSLPETPRISLARRSDVVDYHRLSLNKENINEEFVTGKRIRGRLSQDENRCPGHYARQIVNQVRERVSRRVGLDITNTRHEIRRDETLIPVKSSTKSNHFTSLPTLPEAQLVLDQKPLLRFSDINKNHKQAANLGTKSSRISAPCHNENSDPQQPKNCRKLPSSLSGHSIRNKKKEAFVTTSKAKFAERRQPKKVSVSSELPVKKDPSPPATKLPQKQSQEVSNALSSKRNTQLRHPYRQQPAVDRATAAAEYRWYIQRILKRAGIIDGFTTQWHSPSHPLNPSIFYYLELFHPSAASGAVLRLRCNRKLIFQLVDELLAEILRLQPNPSTPGVLTDELCRRIEGFPAAHCLVLEDIDSLVDREVRDVEHTDEYGGGTAWLVEEIEGEIMDRLLRETAVETVGGCTAVSRGAPT